MKPDISCATKTGHFNLLRTGAIHPPPKARRFTKEILGDHLLRIKIPHVVAPPFPRFLREDGLWPGRSRIVLRRSASRGTSRLLVRWLRTVVTVPAISRLCSRRDVTLLQPACDRGHTCCCRRGIQSGAIKRREAATARIIDRASTKEGTVMKAARMALRGTVGAICALFLFGTSAVQRAHAQTETVLFNFTSASPHPGGPLLLDSAGNILGRNAGRRACPGRLRHRVRVG